MAININNETEVVQGITNATKETQWNEDGFGGKVKRVEFKIKGKKEYKVRINFSLIKGAFRTTTIIKDLEKNKIIAEYSKDFDTKAKTVEECDKMFEDNIHTYFYNLNNSLSKQEKRIKGKNTSTDKKYNVGDSVKLKSGKTGIIEDYDEEHYYIRDQYGNLLKVGNVSSREAREYSQNLFGEYLNPEECLNEKGYKYRRRVLGKEAELMVSGKDELELEKILDDLEKNLGQDEDIKISMEEDKDFKPLFVKVVYEI